MKISPNQRKYLFKLLPEVYKSNRDVRAKLVREYTLSPELTSVSDLSFDQANKIIKRFGGTPVKYDNWGSFDAKKKSHRLILSLCIQNNWQKWNPHKGVYQADIIRLSEFLKSPKSPVKKPLKDMSSTEVSKIIVALENMQA